jgi:hypothetical protein
VRKVAPSGIISTVAAQMGRVDGVAVDAGGNIYISDTTNERIRKVSPSGVINTFAGTGAAGSSGDGDSALSAQFNSPTGMVLDSSGNLYVADTVNFKVRKISPPVLPVITPAGIVPVYSASTTMQPGSGVSIYGSGFATTTTVWNGDFPTSLGGVNVTINSKPAFLWFVSPTQINLQAPSDTATGPVTVVVTTANGSGSSTAILRPPSAC